MRVTSAADSTRAAQTTLCQDTPDLSMSHVGALSSSRQGKLRDASSISWAACVPKASAAWWLKTSGSLLCRELWRALCA